MESKLTKSYKETIWSAHLRHGMRGNLLADNTYLMESSLVLEILYIKILGYQSSTIQMYDIIKI